MILREVAQTYSLHKVAAGDLPRGPHASGKMEIPLQDLMELLYIPIYDSCLPYPNVNEVDFWFSRV